jgi:hypothetical protein
MRIIRSFVMGTALAGAFATPVLAQDFRFTVPVQVSHVPPNVKSLSVLCETGPNSPGNPFRVLAQGTSAPQPVNGGAFSGEFVVSVNAGTWEWRQEMQAWYKCYVLFQATDPVSGTAFEYFRPSPPPVQLSSGQLGPTVPPAHLFPLAATPPSVYMVQGQIPRSSP